MASTPTRSGSPSWRCRRRRWRSPGSAISENGGVATVTATLDKPAVLAGTVTVSAAPGAGTDFTQTGAALTFAAGASVSAGTVTIAAIDNADDEADKAVTVSGTTNVGLEAPPGVTLTIEDDEAPTMTLSLSEPDPANADTISESGGVSTVTAVLDRPANEAATVTVSAAPGTNAAPGDYTLGAARTLTIAAGRTASTGTVTLTAVDDDVHAPDRRVTVSAAVTGGNGLADPAGATLAIAEDEALPAVTLFLSEPDSAVPDTIAESGGVTTVTAALSGKSSDPVTVTVRAAPVVSSGAGPGDFDLSATTTLTIAARATASAGEVTVTANDDDVHAPGRRVTVSAAVTGGNGVAGPAGVTLALAEDETLPTLALVLSPSSVTEAGGVSTVTATLSGPSGQAVTVRVAAAPVPPAMPGDFTLGAARRLVIAAGRTTGAGTVTITANDDGVGGPDKSVTVSGTAAGGNGAANPPDATLTITEAEAASRGVDVCARTPQVAAAIRSRLGLGGSVCRVTAAQLAGITGRLQVSGPASLRHGDFDGLSGVTHLEITGAATLTSLPASPFDEMAALVRLDLSTVRLTSLPSGMFDGLTRLGRIDLGGLYTARRRGGAASGTGAGAHRRGRAARGVGDLDRERRLDRRRGHPRRLADRAPRSGRLPRGI